MKIYFACKGMNLQKLTILIEASAFISVSNIVVSILQYNAVYAIFCLPDLRGSLFISLLSDANGKKWGCIVFTTAITCITVLHQIHVPCTLLPFSHNWSLNIFVDMVSLNAVMNARSSSLAIYERHV